tara:strand:+ start:67 stop:402 length:336 start_codon:yes stop_codon:yes gene_type:complete
MKSYKQFVAESNQSKEILEGWGAVFNVLRGGAKAGAFTSAFNTAALGHAALRGFESIKDGDKFGVYNAVAQGLPATNPFSTAVKLGAMGLDQLRLKKRDDERKKREAEAKK